MAMKSSDTPDTVILVTPGGLLTATPFSAMTWSRPTVDNTGTPIGVWSSALDGQRSWRIRFSDAPVRARAHVSFDGVTDSIAFSVTALSLNVWAHIGMDFDGTTIRLYINGVVNATLAASGTIFASSRNLGICGYDDGGGATASELDGDVEDMRYYNRILKVEEWATIHRVRGLDGIVQGLVTRWPINERPAGTTIVAADPKDVGPAQLSISSVVGSPIYIEGELRERRAA